MIVKQNIPGWGGPSLRADATKHSRDGPGACFAPVPLHARCFLRHTCHGARHPRPLNRHGTSTGMQRFQAPTEAAAAERKSSLCPQGRRARVARASRRRWPPLAELAGCCVTHSDPGLLALGAWCWEEVEGCGDPRDPGPAQGHVRGARPQVTWPSCQPSFDWNLAEQQPELTGDLPAFAGGARSPPATQLGGGPHRPGPQCLRGPSRVVRTQTRRRVRTA